MLVNKMSEVVLEIGIDNKSYEDQMKMLSKLLLDMRKKMDLFTFNTNVASKHKVICEHCGYDWTDKEYDGSCCEKALKEYSDALESAACGGI